MKKVRNSTVIKPAKELKNLYVGGNLYINTMTALDKEAIDRTLAKLIEQLESLVEYSSSTMISEEFGDVSVDQAAYVTYRLSELGYFVHFEHGENNISKLFISLYPIATKFNDTTNPEEVLEIENKKLKEEVNDLRCKNGALGRQVNDLRASKIRAENQTKDLLNMERNWKNRYFEGEIGWNTQEDELCIDISGDLMDWVDRKK